MIELTKIFFKIPAMVFHGIIVVSQSFQRHTSGQHYRPIILAAALSMIFSSSSAQVTVKFNVTANDKPLVLNDSNYTNAFNETYQLTRLKYYISNLNFAGNKSVDYNREVFLLDAGNLDSLQVNILPGVYSKLYFTLGIDSVLNCSGAQDGALDPLNGMFWTWNSGYIFFKMEGYSTSSAADLHRIEHHVGGYRFPNNVARKIVFDLPRTLEIEEGKKYTINIHLNLDKYWKGINEIKIAHQALLMTPGGLALKAADNFPGMFSIKSIE